ncbi:hypothetical protein H8A95_15865 [Bradyrhizobium sp. Pear76]|uniref:hypothetical protein n=1 Tax=Bradyrhizobium oropedii TaxID=1571201 RepID=UPI001E606ED5|nr:hypothetical protein [Bradyrhizobium oropedii]MCC8963747.1 hypothetical protein [Bradyrhizobium oropedii]
MAFAFDTLGYSKHLQDAGVARREADAHAEAAREFVMNELVTKADLALALDNLKSSMTIRLGSIVAAGVAALAILQRVH